MLSTMLMKKIGKNTVYEILIILQNKLQKKYHSLDSATVLSDYKSLAISCYLKEMMLREEPFFLGRIGGSDFEIANKYYNNNKIYSSNRMYEKDLQVAKHYNGYFDFSNDKSKFINYIKVLINSYINTDSVSYGGKNMIDQFNNSMFLDRNYKFFNQILHRKVVFDYTFFEAVSPFLQSFKEWGGGKKILFISPFSESIEYQFRKKDELITGYKYPDFMLLTYTTKITYNNYEDSKEKLCLTTEHWHEECLKIKKDISAIDFDIAFLSCGSYAMPIGSFIKTELNKKAIYLGGIINVLFNIYGSRYDTAFFNNIVNIDSQIEPFENKLITEIRGGRLAKSESLNAYFGKKR